MTAWPAPTAPLLLTGAARVAGVMGWPVSHSRSPRLHGLWLARYGIDGAYIPLPVRPDDLADALAALPKLGLRGVNITVPLKELALPLMHRLTPEAQRIGAVNTVVVNEDGTLLGSNTDGFGFLENLRQAAPHWRAVQGPAVVLGAGGAARAVVFALQSEGAPDIRLVNRSAGRAATLAAELGGPIHILPWSERCDALAGAALLVNTTTLGMAGAPALELDLAVLPRTALVTDIVYTPLVTPLLAAAAARGNPVVDGLGMLLHQARPGFAAWFGRMPEVTPDIRQALEETIVNR